MPSPTVHATACLAASILCLQGCQPRNAPLHAPPSEPTLVAAGVKASTEQDRRMAWWRDARFGMFIHWGLYAIPAGQWNGTGKTSHGEWIRDTAQVPVEEYDQLKNRFNPVRFDANAWAAAAKGAGMKYLCITSKHHDGFCLFDSKHTDWDVMSTPFKRDIMTEIATACRANGITPCWYHSIMDWHHPDYLPRRPWENRPTEGADFDRFNTYLKNQVTELLTNYGPIGVMWFDGQWEGTWTHPRGLDLAAHVRKLQPNCIINNRVDKGGGQFGMTRAGYAGDYGTPEQEIPPTGYPGVDWETCMTMNNHWGYNQWDHNFKTTEDLIRKLADIASKGGNFLLNVGPTADGEIPPTSIERLREIGQWMRVNGESIHGTQAGPFGTGVELPWGRCTQRVMASNSGKPGTRLYLHVFDWPTSGKLVVPGLYNEARRAVLLSNPTQTCTVVRRDDSLEITVPSSSPDPLNTVIALDIDGRPDVGLPPVIEAGSDIFVGTSSATIVSKRDNIQLRYTTDGADPTAQSPVVSAPVPFKATTTLAARAFRGDRPVSPITRRTFTLVTPSPGVKIPATQSGVSFRHFEGSWSKLPDFATMTPTAVGVVTAFDRKPRKVESQFGFRYQGFLRVPTDGVYRFWIASDDGSNLYVDDKLLIDNDGLHSLQEKTGAAALAAGYHPISIDFFEQSGGHELDVWWASPSGERMKLSAADLVTPKP